MLPLSAVNSQERGVPRSSLKEGLGMNAVVPICAPLVRWQSRQWQWMTMNGSAEHS
jgi:hypothetical protein